MLQGAHQICMCCSEVIENKPEKAHLTSVEINLGELGPFLFGLVSYSGLLLAAEVLVQA